MENDRNRIMIERSKYRYDQYRNKKKKNMKRIKRRNEKREEK